MKIDIQTLNSATLCGVRSAYYLCFRDGVSFEEHFAECEGSAGQILARAHDVCEMVYEGKTPEPLGDLPAKDRDAIIVALRVVQAAQVLLDATGWDNA